MNSVSIPRGTGSGGNSSAAPPDHAWKKQFDRSSVIDDEEVVPAGGRRQPLPAPKAGAEREFTVLAKHVKRHTWRALFRLVLMLASAFVFLAARFVHWIIFRDIEERRRRNARWLRASLEQLGGALVKLGQQMSLRLDVLPADYCRELAKLLDRMPPFPVKQAYAAIQRQTGKSVEELFTFFDPVPVGSASVACVYRAILKNGPEVAVKVRRPKIHAVYIADITAMDWIVKIFEFLAVLRRGMSENFRTELRELLLDELDFRMEARYQELFRYYLKQRKKLRVTAPKIYYKISGEEVVVSEFVRGILLTDVLAAVEANDCDYLEYLRELDIHPKTIARRLIRSRYYTFHECPLFHGDPHPANIIVQPENRIVMVDFGACGVFSERDRKLMWQMNYYYSREDVGGMVRMVIGLMEPVPRIDIEKFQKELLDAWWIGFYGIKSRHAEWWERTSFRLWIRLLQLIKKYKAPIPRNMLRMIRATLLFDTVAARLYPKINVFDEFEKYRHDLANRTRIRLETSVISQLLCGPSDSTVLRLQQIKDIGTALLFRLEKFLSDPEFDLQAVASKIYYAIQAVVRLTVICTMAGVLAAVLGLGVDAILHRGISLGVRIDRMMHPIHGDSRPLEIAFWAWLVIVAMNVYSYGRHIMFRFSDIDDTD